MFHFLAPLIPQAFAAGPIDSGLANEIIGGASQAAKFANLVSTATALDPRIVAARIMAGALGFVGLIFIIRIVYAGVLWFTAQGSPDPIKKAQKILIQSSIGAVLLFSSLGIARFLQFRLINTMEENMLDAVTTCSGAAGACCQEWANFQNSSGRTGFTNPSDNTLGGDATQRKLLADWKTCRQNRGSW